MIANSSTLCYNIDIFAKIINANQYIISTSTNCSMYLTKYSYSRLIFDKTAIESLTYCYFTYGEIYGSNNIFTGLTLTTNPYFNNNFIFGLKSIYIKGLNANTNISINFNTLLNTVTTVTVKLNASI